MLGIIRWKEDTLLRYTVILIELRRSLFSISLVQAFYVLNIFFSFSYRNICAESLLLFLLHRGVYLRILSTRLLLVFAYFFAHMFIQKSSIAVAIFNVYVKIVISAWNKCNKYDINEKMILRNDVDFLQILETLFSR